MHLGLSENRCWLGWTLGKKTTEVFEQQNSWKWFDWWIQPSFVSGQKRLGWRYPKEKTWYVICMYDLFVARYTSRRKFISFSIRKSGNQPYNRGKIPVEPPRMRPKIPRKRPRIFQMEMERWRVMSWLLSDKTSKFDTNLWLDVDVYLNFFVGNKRADVFVGVSKLGWYM